MKKSELKTGMVVEVREGRQYLVMLGFVTTSPRGIKITEDRMLKLDGSGQQSLDPYEEDMTLRYAHKGDIVKVYTTNAPRSLIHPQRNLKLVWEEDSKEVKEAKEGIKALEDILAIRKANLRALLGSNL